ncbi:uncharacterized protein LOC122728049 isoform X2 [Dromiciops gliroides]|uniref:uncharacterized protein LOC122728049 isoform X2 n=1 Tax=Dromiciops gliroides TaxID=33562 RepID=UPI001CC6AD3D|nr:uncharacterized protein LOC122728049 isoform X2 [Dromiciops gliroides]
MRLWLLSLVAGITLGVAVTPLGKVSTGTEQAEEEKETQDKPKRTKREFFIIGGYSGMTAITDRKDEGTIRMNICNDSCNVYKLHHMESFEKEKEGKGQREVDLYRESLGTLNFTRTILLQLLNQSKALNGSSKLDFAHWNLNASITRHLCEDCCEEKEEPSLGSQPMQAPMNPKRRQPNRWTILGSLITQLGNSSINTMIMTFHNDTHINYDAKKVIQQAENFRRRWCSACCEDDEILETLERSEEEVRATPPAWR